MVAVPDDESLRTLEKLVTKKGVMLGRLPRDELLLTLAWASLCIPTSVDLSESAASQALKNWLEGEGSILRIDHVELRRTLIDMGFWTRDVYGRSYVRLPLDPDHDGYEHLEALQSVNVASFVAEARARSEARRAERMLMHAGKGAGNSRKLAG